MSEAGVHDPSLPITAEQIAKRQAQVAAWNKHQALLRAAQMRRNMRLGAGYHEAGAPNLMGGMTEHTAKALGLDGPALAIEPLKYGGTFKIDESIASKWRARIKPTKDQAPAALETES